MAYLDENEINNEEAEVVGETTSTEEEIVVEAEENETGKSVKDNQKGSKQHFKKTKGAFSELKKVTWPTFGRVVKETLVVLSVTTVFLVVIFGIDQLLSLLYNLLV